MFPIPQEGPPQIGGAAHRGHAGAEMDDELDEDIDAADEDD